MKAYFLRTLDSPLIVAAQDENTAITIFTTDLGIKCEVDHISELADCALDAKGKNSETLRKKLEQTTAAAIIGRFPVDFSVVEWSIRQMSLSKMINFNMVLLGAPISKIKLVSRSMKLDEHQRKFRNWIKDTFNIYVFSVQDIKALQAHLAALQAMLSVEAERKAAKAAAISRIDKDYFDRIEQLRAAMGY